MVTVTILRWGYKPNYKYISCFFYGCRSPVNGTSGRTFPKSDPSHDSLFQLWNLRPALIETLLTSLKKNQLKITDPKKIKVPIILSHSDPPWRLKHPLFIRARNAKRRQMGAPQSAAAATVEASPSKKPRSLKRTLEDGNSWKPLGKCGVKQNCEVKL